jgi:hypothetical protein
MYLTLVPAFGRDYKSKAEVQRDLDANKDFIIQSYGHPYDGKPANASSLRAAGVKTVNIRYKRLTAVGVFKIGAGALSSNPVFAANPSLDMVSAAAGVGIFVGAVWLANKIFGS